MDSCEFGAGSELLRGFFSERTCEISADTEKTYIPIAHIILSI